MPLSFTNDPRPRLVNPLQGYTDEQILEAQRALNEATQRRIEEYRVFATGDTVHIPMVQEIQARDIDDVPAEPSEPVDLRWTTTASNNIRDMWVTAGTTVYGIDVPEEPAPRRRTKATRNKAQREALQQFVASGESDYNLPLEFDEEKQRLHVFYTEGYGQVIRLCMIDFARGVISVHKDMKHLNKVLQSLAGREGLEFKITSRMPNHRDNQRVAHWIWQHPEMVDDTGLVLVTQPRIREVPTERRRNGRLISPVEWARAMANGDVPF